MNGHETYMTRCMELARLGAGHVMPNPMVGSVLVYNDSIIGEGYHQVYGAPHAEVNCISSVPAGLRHLIPDSTIYVSLEPCTHYGKTPPCADLIIKNKISKVVIGCRDPFKEVNGKGIEKLKAAGLDVTVGILENECKELNKRFFTFYTKHRPYIILKWAETNDKKIGNFGNNRLHITNGFTDRLVHKWRSEEAAIMVGTNTAALDDPQLTNRLWNGNSPARVIIDMNLRLPSSLKIFNGSAETIIFNSVKHGHENGILYYQVTHDTDIVHQVLNGLHQLKVMSVLIEGGALLTQSFIDDGEWDEARVIVNKKLNVGHGVMAPVLSGCDQTGAMELQDDYIEMYTNKGQFANR